MSIKSKDNELFYLGCILSEAIERLDNILKEGVASHKSLLYDARFRFLMKIKEKFSNTLFGYAKY